MSRVLVAAAVAAALCGQALSGDAQADTIVSSSAAANGLVGPAGLSGAYFNVAEGSTNYDIADTLAAMANATATGTFTATNLSYSSSDSGTVTSFLGADAASYRGRTPGAYDMSDAIFNLAGYLYVSAPGTDTFSFSHDDSAQLSIAGQTVITANCCGTDTASVTFQSAGYYAIDAVYSNTYYGGVGNASMTLGENGSVLTAGNLVQSVPEPASLALFGAGLAALCFARRRTATAPSARTSRPA